MKKTSFILIPFLFVSLTFNTLAQVPNLRSDSCFALFTSAGAFNNTGSTTIWGDAGTNVGAFTGSPTVNGNVQVANAVSAQAATDLQTAYAYMSGLSCDSTISTPLGNGRVLLPSVVYCITTASALSGNLILDGQGNTNSKFIIKIGGALSSDSGSHVVLINSASFCNVYWQATGAVTLGANSVFKGTILADGAIGLLNGATLEGRGLTRSGIITLSNNIAVGCDAAGMALPVNLINFTANLDGNHVQLNWSTATETNNNYFTVESAEDALVFKEVTRISGAGNSSTVLHYVATDYKIFTNMMYYRLKQTDFDGTSTYSEIIAIRKSSQTRFNIYPNPFTSTTTFSINSPALINTGAYELRIYNTLGGEVMHLQLKEPSTLLDMHRLMSGIYIYEILNHGDIIQSGRLIAR